MRFGPLRRVTGGQLVVMYERQLLETALDIAAPQERQVFLEAARQVSQA